MFSRKSNVCDTASTQTATFSVDEVAEWLRRWTANPLGSARVGSNPILVANRFYGVMVSTLDFESSDPSSNLGRTYFSLVGSDAKHPRYVKYDLYTLTQHTRFYGVMVSTQDSESCDPSSSLGRTSVLRAL